VCYSEHEILREELKSVVAVKERLKERVAELEDELKKLKEESEASNKQTKSDDEVCVLFLYHRLPMFL
jgi:uncharacterized small protein (DUF1192 family)